MLQLSLGVPERPLDILCLGAHSDDIEIGAGGLLLSLIAARRVARVTWCVLSAAGPRQDEAKRSAASLLAGVGETSMKLERFRDGFFPAERVAIKEWFESVKAHTSPDLVLTHHGDDAHQDHRLVAELTTNTFRDHLVLAYEIPKWDGDLGRPNAYHALSAAVLERKIALLMEHFATQRSKDWFDPETFRGLARLRGMECRAPERYAEAFHARKLLVG